METALNGDFSPKSATGTTGVWSGTYLTLLSKPVAGEIPRG
jgi:hypothetical protein